MINSKLYMPPYNRCLHFLYGSLICLFTSAFMYAFTEMRSPLFMVVSTFAVGFLKELIDELVARKLAKKALNPNVLKNKRKLKAFDFVDIVWTVAPSVLFVAYHYLNNID